MTPRLIILPTAYQRREVLMIDPLHLFITAVSVNMDVRFIYEYREYTYFTGAYGVPAAHRTYLR